MKLSEIEPVARVDAFEKKANFTNEVRYGGEPLYSAKGMQEYAKECVIDALDILDNTILPIFEDDKRVVIQKIFEEDTKND
ncbi:hypothetical protein [Lactococcus lactis]|uniref:hypothetical protein n=1 Tax=Lactococcus lactis TaxID=1358 RepID=UPI0023A96306|nr:hypothetical protein [Lactococcus lactis]WEA55140.1 hypothetical protein PWP91_12810 [Lactococcus lactis]